MRAALLVTMPPLGQHAQNLVDAAVTVVSIPSYRLTEDFEQYPATAVPSSIAYVSCLWHLEQEHLELGHLEQMSCRNSSAFLL